MLDSARQKIVEALTTFIEIGDIDLIKLAADRGYFIGPHLGYPSMIAARNGHLELMEFLISLNVNENLAGELSWAADEAATRGHLNILIFIENKWPNIKLNQELLLSRAAEFNQLEVVKYFVQKGVKINNEAINFTIFNEHDKMLEYLKSVINQEKSNET